jgi:hypothetical protein
MNAVEIEAAISELAAQPFDKVEFPYAFLQAFGNKDTTIKRLRSGETNKSDLGGVLQARNIHILVAPQGKVTQSLDSLRNSPATIRGKARFILTTDGIDFEAEDLQTDDPPVVCAYSDFPDHFGYFLPLAGITTVKQIRESSFDIRATSRLNRLYLELLKENPAWEKADRRHEMNHFMARLIFCFFAEDTKIFQGATLFTATVERMSERDSSNTHAVISEIFRAMNVKTSDRVKTKLPRWTEAFPYVNGELFSGSVDVPKFSKIARTYLLHVGKLDWTKINPDIFGSMIQAVADDEERGALGMHYTSVPNILKVLDPLFLDELRAQLQAAGENPRMLLNLRKRISKIRVFDPACGSGNFLVIAYKQMREIEHSINKLRGEKGRKSDIPLTNFRGIELRDFPAEIARLALIIAEYQCDLLYLGQQEALADFLPLESQNWITCGNALRLDWLSICPPTGTKPIEFSGDLFEPAQPQLDFENEGGETYICGNPPYLGFTWQTSEQKYDLQELFKGRTNSWKSLDYVAGWFIKAADYSMQTNTVAAFVSTNSICQGEQVPILWPLILDSGHKIVFAHTSFKWANLASHNAGVTVAIIGISNQPIRVRRLYSISDDSSVVAKEVENINAYLVPGKNVIVNSVSRNPSTLAPMAWGNKPSDGGNLILSASEANEALIHEPFLSKFILDFVGSQEFVKGIVRRCIWIEDADINEAVKSIFVSKRLAAVREMRASSAAVSTQEYANRPHRFRQIQGRAAVNSIVVPKVTSESRPYLPVGVLYSHSIVSDNAFALYDAPLWNMAIIASRIHLVWIATVCGKLETRYRYSNTLGWNTFPVPVLTEKNKADLTRCAEDILLAREAHFPATIADLYDPGAMPDDLRAAHERNDDALERIYIGRRFRNDTERLEKLFELYTKMTALAKPELKNKSRKNA